jgi:hypothetical protein
MTSTSQCPLLPVPSQSTLGCAAPPVRTTAVAAERLAAVTRLRCRSHDVVVASDLAPNALRISSGLSSVKSEVRRRAWVTRSAVETPASCCARPERFRMTTPELGVGPNQNLTDGAVHTLVDRRRPRHRPADQEGSGVAGPSGTRGAKTARLHRPRGGGQAGLGATHV